MAGQLARGETPSRAAPKPTSAPGSTPRTCWGYFFGVYFRKNTPEDFYLSKLQDDVLHGHVDYAHLDRGPEARPEAVGPPRSCSRTRSPSTATPPPCRYIEAYWPQPRLRHRSSSSGASRDHPVRRPALRPTGHVYSPTTSPRPPLLKGAEFFAVDTSMTTAEAPLRRQAGRVNTYLVTPELKRFWAANDTPAQVRDKMMKHEMYGYLLDLQKTYFSLPETDYDARRGFLRRASRAERRSGRRTTPPPTTIAPRPERAERRPPRGLLRHRQAPTANAASRSPSRSSTTTRSSSRGRPPPARSTRTPANG
jgi:hypothetical protein